MSHSVRPIIDALFAGDRHPGQSVSFSWRLIRRKGRPFMLLPRRLAAARTGLTLYSAQRWPAKLWRGLLPWTLQSPAAGLFEQIQFEAAAGSEILEFLSRQTGGVDITTALVAIKLSEVGERSRLVLLLCDESGRPTRVIKAGLNVAGQLDTNREADFLETLPPSTIGCIRMTGRLKRPFLSAFATDYFPGQSPRDDAGMEHLFRIWLNTSAPMALEQFSLWRDLDAAATAAVPAKWEPVKRALAGRSFCSTLYHGDFTPWNVRVVNSQNLQAFDWERGQLQGLPGWDWFHFTTQTSILSKRLSTERAAAEVEQLIHSERFQKYAAAAGFSHHVRPLLLAYLLHHRWVIKPQEGGRAAADLFDFLAAHWSLAPAVIAHAAARPRPAPGWLLAARRQLKSAAAQWGNLFWEPQLNFTSSLSLPASLKAHWPAALLTGALLAATAATQYVANSNLIFLPFYLVICALATWRVDRSWGVLMATLSGVAGPLVVAVRDPAFREPEVWLWNTVMRFVVLQICVLFVDRIHQQMRLFRHLPQPGDRPARLAENWAVLFASGLLFAIVTGLDWLTDPRINFLPLYMFPCMVITLVLNLRWGLVATVLATFTGALIEDLTTKDYSAKIFGWNFGMRFAVCLLVIVLLDRIRRENILFARRKSAPR